MYLVIGCAACGPRVMLFLPKRFASSPLDLVPFAAGIFIVGGANHRRQFVARHSFVRDYGADAILDFTDAGTASTAGNFGTHCASDLQ